MAFLMVEATGFKPATFLFGIRPYVDNVRQRRQIDDRAQAAVLPRLRPYIHMEECRLGHAWIYYSVPENNDIA